MSEIIGLSFGFENCEECFVPIEYVNSFSLLDITKCVHSLNRPVSTIKEYEVIGKMHVNFTNSFAVNCSDVFQRIMEYKDICWFSIKYLNNVEKEYMVKWFEGSDEYENSGQNIKFYEFGDIILSINLEK
jgi:hypothetical protein